MTTAPQSRNPHPVDACARRAHDGALAQLSPDTLARLREARREATAHASPRRPALAPWLAGGALASALVLAVVMHPGLLAPLPAAGTTTATVPVDGTAADAAFAAAADPDVAGPLQEDPGFYVWLESVDANALAME